MTKSTVQLDISAIAKMFGQTEKYTDAMLKKHGVTVLPLCRIPGDGLDVFYSDMTAFYNTEPSLTKQEFTESCDPNFILDRHLRGQDINLNANPIYGDFTQIPASYHEALGVVTRARQSFMQLDPKLRAKFENDPAQFVDFVSNPENSQALIDLGLAVAKPFESLVSAAPVKAPAAENIGGVEGA